jgi:OmpA-OmpF porin, OOP family
MPVTAATPADGGAVAAAEADDSDRDRIGRAYDRCPDAPETYQGCDDLDGCPDDSSACHRNLAPWYRSEVLVVEFSSGSIAIPPAHGPWVRGAGHQLREPWVGAVICIGQASPAEPVQDLEGISRQRAEAVCSAVSREGVPSDRLTAHGVGIGPVRVDGEREKSRVVVYALTVYGQPAWIWNGTRLEEGPRRPRIPEATPLRPH